VIHKPRSFISYAVTQLASCLSFWNERDHTCLSSYFLVLEQPLLKPGQAIQHHRGFFAIIGGEVGVLWKKAYKVGFSDFQGLPKYLRDNVSEDALIIIHEMTSLWLSKMKHPFFVILCWYVFMTKT
jgi:hypothetical protein